MEQPGARSSARRSGRRKPRGRRETQRIKRWMLERGERSRGLTEPSGRKGAEVRRLRILERRKWSGLNKLREIFFFFFFA